LFCAAVQRGMTGPLSELNRLKSMLVPKKPPGVP
jgi:hypothetical protein